jgi:hypothetical protein
VFADEETAVIQHLTSLEDDGAAFFEAQSAGTVAMQLEETEEQQQQQQGEGEGSARVCSSRSSCRHACLSVEICMQRLAQLVCFFDLRSPLTDESCAGSSGSARNIFFPA